MNKWLENLVPYFHTYLESNDTHVFKK